MGSVRRRAPLLVATCVLVVAAIAFIPVTTRRALDYVVTEQRIPLWRKAKAFLARHRRTSALADSLFRPIADPEARALFALTWTNERVQERYPQVPVVDDHIWNIIERGHGSNDQKADVFATLLTYAGTPSYWTLIGPKGDFPITLTRIDGAWRVFDVENGIAFRDSNGNLATPEQLAADPSLITRSALPHVTDTSWYRGFFEGFSPPRTPRTLRAEMQMPVNRLRYELRTLLAR